MIAQHRAGTAGVAQRDDLAEGGEGFGAAVDEVADETQGPIGGEGGQQRLERGAAALEVADGVGDG